MSKFSLKFQYNAPITLTFTLLALAVLALNGLTGGAANALVFSVYRAPLSDPLFYVRLFGHVLGHQNFAHLAGNAMLILAAGPMVEAKYGGRAIVLMIAVTALVTSVLHVLFVPGGQLLGASGIAFMLVLLGSFGNVREGRIPLTLILCAIVWITPEIRDSIVKDDHVAHYAHIIGGVCGAGFGYILSKRGKAEKPV